MIPPLNYAKRGRDLRLRSPAHLAWVRKHMCCIFDKHTCAGKVEAAHLRSLAPEKGLGTKPSDVWAVGMCRSAHREAECREVVFQEKYGVDLLSLALDYGESSPDKRVKAAAGAIRSLMKMQMSQAELGEMVEAVLKKIREQESA